ncbi:MAG: phosphatase [Rectinemataceae bacterium]|jgi:putative hydrolase
MRIAIDTHTHTVASGHAYSTVYELAMGARKRHLKGFVLTDHGPALPGGTHPYHFGNLRVLPDRMRGVRFYRGIEANILDQEGSLDLSDDDLRQLHFVYAGLHETVFPPRAEAENTRALVAALSNPLVDAVSHPGNPIYPVDIRTVVLAAKEFGKAIEINDSSFRIRKGSTDRCGEFARLCARTGTLVVCGSDAHYWEDVGRLDQVIALLGEAHVPRDLVINATTASFEAFLERRAGEKKSLRSFIE